MNTRKSASMPAVLTLAMVAAVGLSACGGAPPEARAGAWRGSTEFGSFTFTITPEGTAVEDAQYAFHCGDNSFDSSNFRMGEPHPLDGRDFAFGVYVAGQIPMADWEGRFSRDGGTLTGTLTILGGLCETDFEITR